MLLVLHFDRNEHHAILEYDFFDFSVWSENRQKLGLYQTVIYYLFMFSIAEQFVYNTVHILFLLQVSRVTASDKKMLWFRSWRHMCVLISCWIKMQLYRTPSNFLLCAAPKIFIICSHFILLPYSF